MDQRVVRLGGELSHTLSPLGGEGAPPRAAAQVRGWHKNIEAAASRPRVGRKFKIRAGGLAESAPAIMVSSGAGNRGIHPDLCLMGPELCAVLPNCSASRPRLYVVVFLKVTNLGYISCTEKTFIICHLG